MKKTAVILCAFIAIFISASLSAERQRVAVVGSGGSGLTTAWLLDEDFDVAVFESQDRLGGHANSIDVDVHGKTVTVEAGFEFIAEKQFPHFFNLLQNILKVPLHKYTLTTNFYKTDSSSILLLPPIHDGVVEWKSFAPHDIFTMVEFDYLLEKSHPLIHNRDVGITFGDFVESLHLTHAFKEEFLFPFVAAGWGVSKDDIKQFAAYDALKYVVDGKEEVHYQWIEIVGGTQKYIKALAAQLENTLIKLSSTITNIEYADGIYTITESDGSVAQFDHLVIATNAMQACKLLQNIPETEDIRSILGQITYFKTTIAIHGDPRFMPPDNKDWRVVNVRYDGINSATTVYKNWLSDSASPVFKSWITFDVRPDSDQGSPMPDPLYAIEHYDHPKADLHYFQAQKAIGMVQGNRGLWFAGNYTYDNDSHESAIVSAINVAKMLAPQSSRLAQITDISN